MAGGHALMHLFFAREGEWWKSIAEAFEVRVLLAFWKDNFNFYLISGSIGDENPEEFKFDVHTTFTVSL